MINCSVVVPTHLPLELILEPCFVDFEADMLSFVNHVHHITNGNNMRFFKSSEIKEDISWISGLSESDRAFFDKKTGYLNRGFGYS